MLAIVFARNGSSDLIDWTISVPKLLSKWPRRRAINSQIEFAIKNHSESPIRIKIEVQSKSRMLIFRSIIKRKVGRNRIKETTEKLHEVVEKGIKPQSEALFRFPFHFQPHFGRLRSSSLEIKYLIVGFSEEGKELFHSGPDTLTIFPDKEA